jgi:hypothetical protein
VKSAAEKVRHPFYKGLLEFREDRVDLPKAIGNSRDGKASRSTG